MQGHSARDERDRPASRLAYYLKIDGGTIKTGAPSEDCGSKRGSDDAPAVESGRGAKTPNRVGCRIGATVSHDQFLRRAYDCISRAAETAPTRVSVHRVVILGRVGNRRNNVPVLDEFAVLHPENVNADVTIRADEPGPVCVHGNNVMI